MAFLLVLVTMIGLMLPGFALTGCTPSGNPVNTGNTTDTAASITVLSTSGTVDIERSGSTLEARAGMRLVNQDIMQTAAASSSWLTLDEYKAVQLGEKTNLQVDKQASKLALTLTKGEITARIDKPLDADESFSVYVGNITLGVRGTVFTVRFDGVSTVTVSVESGVVAVMDSSGKDIDELHENESRTYNTETAAPIPTDNGQGPGSGNGIDTPPTIGNESPTSNIDYAYTDLDAFLTDLLAAFEENGSASIFSFAETPDYSMLTSQTTVYPAIHFDGSGTYGIGLYGAGRYIYIGDYSGTIRSGFGYWFSLDDGEGYMFEGAWANDKPNGDGFESTVDSGSSGRLVDGLWDGEQICRYENEPGFKYYYDFSEGYRILFEGEPPITQTVGNSTVFALPCGSVFEEDVMAENYIGFAYRPESEFDVLHGIAGFVG